MSTRIPLRSEIAVEWTWDAASVYADDQAWEAAFAELDAELNTAEGYKGRLHEQPEQLADWLETVDRWRGTAEKLFTYALMFRTVDMADSAAGALYSRATAISARCEAAVAFTEPELLAIGFETLDNWMEQSSRLAVYRHAFDKLKIRAPHVRSAEVEELLGKISEPFSSASMIHSVLSDADLVFEQARGSDGSSHDVGHGAIGSLLVNPDREVRRTAWENYADAFLAHKNSMASCMETGVKQQVFLARARNYATGLDASLALGNVPNEVFHSLLETFRKHLPTWHRYWHLRRKVFGYKQMHEYDIKAPLTSKSPHVPFSKAMDWISAGMQPLGDEYVSIMRKGVLEDRWVDVYPNQNKRMGAFSAGTQGTHPFILMSYNDDIFSMSTLAHELGHSMHSYYAWQTQPPVYSNYALFVAEVASNFNQAMVRAHLLKESDDRDFQIAVIEEAMSNFHRYFFIMPTLSRFELEIHTRVENGQALSADSLNNLMADLYAEAYGDAIEIDRDRIGSTWSQFPTHLYYHYYIFQYATGISGAHALVDGILKEGKPAAERYINFLKAGGSSYPLDALKQAGVDLSTSAAVESTFAVLESYVDRLEGLLL
jgi:oligoendopeptidase F